MPGGSLTGQTPEVTVLQDIFDLIVAALGGKATYPRPTPAVAAAIEETRSARTLAVATDIIAVMTPWAVEA